MPFFQADKGWARRIKVYAYAYAPSLLINESTLTRLAETKSTSCGLVNNIMELSVLYGGVAIGKIKTLRDGETSVLLCETEFPTFKIARQKHLRFLSIAKKIETPRPQICWKMRLQDPWNSAKILRDPDFLKDHSPPLYKYGVLNSNQAK